MRTAKRTLGVLSALTLLLLAAIVTLLFTSRPDHSGTVQIAGIDAPVTIERDRWGVPYIEAASERDGYAALGFVHAQDRLWQMELRRRIGAGRLAELMGAGALSVDRFMRLLRLHDLAAASLDAMRPENRSLVSAYTAGVNAYLDSRTRPLPPEFWVLWHRPEPWTDADSVVWIKLMALDLARNWREEVLRARLLRALPPATYRALFPDQVGADDATLAAAGAALEPLDLAALAARVGPPPPAGHGSNAWVVAGDRTRSGTPLLANDPHLGFEMPGVWYLAGLETPNFEVVGATLPGLPIFATGRTDRFAWGLTNTGSDVQDLVIERLIGTPATATATPDGSAPLDHRQSTIRCRVCSNERFVSRWSVNGPLVTDLVASAEDVAGAGHALALRWNALTAADTTVEAGFAVPRARDWQSFNDALRRFTNPQMNVFYADRDGRIGLVSPGLVPIRASGNGTLPQPGWQDESAWVGFIPFEALPRRIDPGAGMLANANNAIVGADYPYPMSGSWDEPYRYHRIRNGLVGGGHDVAGFRVLQNDVRSGVAADLLPLFLAARPLSDAAASWAERLAAWDLETGPESRAATVFAAWYDAVPEVLYADELGDLFEAYGRQRPRFIRSALTTSPHWCNDVRTDRTETCAEILAVALERALLGLERALGPEGPAWAWGRQHPTRFEHALWNRLGPLGHLATVSLPLGGDDTTVAAASYVAQETAPLFPASHGVSYRQIVDPARPADARFVAATGQVGHPASPHYRDLTREWLAGRDIPMTAPARPTAVLTLLPE